MNIQASRRSFLAGTVAAAAAALHATPAFAAQAEKFQSSLAEWSLHKTLFAGKLNNLDFAATAKQ
ncbi:MAG: sugar phosphate isomerase/epimerase, partial [Planctomyces sp.]